MASDHSYKITISNNKSEKEAIDYLLQSNESFIQLDNANRKILMEFLGIESRFSRAFDLIQIKGHSSVEKAINLSDKSSITLIELKTTKKELPNNPKGFFFGATKNEFDLAKRMGDQYKFCFVTLHPNTLGYKLLTLEEMERIIRNKRIQYQINL